MAISREALGKPNECGGCQDQDHTGKFWGSPKDLAPIEKVWRCFSPREKQSTDRRNYTASIKAATFSDRPQRL
jgi:hypothetical protein